MSEVLALLGSGQDECGQKFVEKAEARIKIMKVMV
jgi:hypothetical protein